jgi:hypothetical protein
MIRDIALVEVSSCESCPFFYESYDMDRCGRLEPVSDCTLSESGDTYHPSLSSYIQDAGEYQNSIHPNCPLREISAQITIKKEQGK